MSSGTTIGIDIPARPEKSTPGLSLRRVWSTWWPLASSWIFMGLELPMVSAVLARLANPDVNLAAYGGIVFAIAILIEAPVIMLLSASTALVRDWASYVALRRFAVGLGLSLSALHALIAFTPLYDLVVTRLIDAPAEIVEPARTALRLVTPWTFMIAVRRFQQGVLIRAGRSRSVGLATATRLMLYAVVLLTGALVGGVPGASLAGLGAAVAVTVEAFVVRLRVQPVLRDLRARAEGDVDPGAALAFGEFLRFYVPLAITPVITLLALPIMSGSLSRMPMPLESLAVWPVLGGLVFTFRSCGFAYNEVVLSLIDEPGALPALRRFAQLLAASLTLLLLLVVATPLASGWFGGVSGLRPELAELGRSALWIALVFPALSVFQSFNQSRIVHSRKTRGVTEAVALQLATIVTILVVGVAAGAVAGVFVGITANVVGNAVQLGWLWRRRLQIDRPAPGKVQDL